MGWAVGFDVRWNRDIGYGVPCQCDHPECTEEIDRGLAHVCGGERWGGEDGCGLYFCGKHLAHYRDADGAFGRAQCERCAKDAQPFDAKADVPQWVEHKLKCPTWQRWRDENPNDVAALTASLHQRKGEE